MHRQRQIHEPGDQAFRTGDHEGVVGGDLAREIVVECPAGAGAGHQQRAQGPRRRRWQGPRKARSRRARWPPCRWRCADRSFRETRTRPAAPSVRPRDSAATRPGPRRADVKPSSSSTGAATPPARIAPAHQPRSPRPGPAQARIAGCAPARMRTQCQHQENPKPGPCVEQTCQQQRRDIVQQQFRQRGAGAEQQRCDQCTRNAGIYSRHGQSAHPLPVLPGARMPFGSSASLTASLSAHSAWSL